MRKSAFRFVSLIVLFALIIRVNSTAHASQGVLSLFSGELITSKIYYVNPAGSDLNSGSQSSPFKTLAKGVSVLTAGDTLVIAGRFTQPLEVLKSGTANAPLKIIGDGAVLDMKGSQDTAIKLGGNHLNISGFDVQGSNSHAVLIGGKYILFENSSVHHSILSNGSGTCLGSGSWGSAVKVMVGGENVTIRGNTVYENCGEGIAVTRGINVLVEGNTVRDNFGVNIYLDNSSYITVRNNTISCTGIYLRNGNPATGIAIAEEEYSGWGAQRHHNNILNNNIDGCYDGIASWEPEVSGGKLVDSVLSGNVVLNGFRRSIALYSENRNVLVENNNVYTEIMVAHPSGVTLRNNSVEGAGLPAPVIYDDKHQGFNYSSGWGNVSKSRAYGNSYKVTSKKGARVIITFSGESFSILYTGGPAFRKMRVYVDGALVGTINQRRSSGAYQQQWDYPGQLSPGTHTLKLVFVTRAGTTNTKGSLDAVIVQ